MCHRPNCLTQLVFSPSFVEEKILKLRREEGAGITAAMAGGCSRELGWVARGHREGGGALRLSAQPPGPVPQALSLPVLHPSA